jgi:hypothetical protein
MRNSIWMLLPPNASDQAELHHISTANTILIYQEKLSMGQLELIGKGSLFTLWAQVSTSAAVLLVHVPAYCSHNGQLNENYGT